MAKELAKLFVTLGLDDSEFQKKVNNIQKTLTQAGKMITGMGLAITAALGLSVKAAEEDRVSQARLAGVLQNVSVSYDQVKDSLKATMDATMQKTGVSDEDQRAALSELIITTGDYKQALDLLPTALDLMATGQVDAVDAAKLLGKTSEGSATALARFGIILDQNATAAERVAAIQAKLGGLAEKTASPFSVLTGNIHELTVSIGDQLLPVLTGLLQKIEPIIQGVIEWMKNNPGLTQTLVLITAAVGGLMAVLGPLLMMLPMIAAGFTMMLGPVGLVILAITALGALAALIITNLTRTIKDESKKQLEAKKQALADEQDATTSAYNKNIADIRAYYGVLDSQAKDSAQTQMDQARNASAERGKQIDIEIAALQTAHDTAVGLYEDEYLQKIMFIDQATWTALQPIDQELASIRTAQDAENKARQDKANADQLASLRDAVVNAKTVSEKEGGAKVIK